MNMILVRLVIKIAEVVSNIKGDKLDKNILLLDIIFYLESLWADRYNDANLDKIENIALFKQLTEGHIDTKASRLNRQTAIVDSLNNLVKSMKYLIEAGKPISSETLLMGISSPINIAMLI
jgi:hypothetical protein